MTTTKATLLLLSAILTLSPLLLAEPMLQNEKDKLSYTIGLEAGKTIRSRSFDIDPTLLQAGITDGLSGRKPRLDKNEIEKLTAAAENETREKKAAARQAQGEKNAIEGPQFLAENKTKEGVKITASGLQYKVLQRGTGRTPGENDRVVVNFVGMTIDGKEFENTHTSGHAETLPINRMIKGWREGLQLMGIGSEYRFYVPAELAFGKLGAGVIAPNATLIFDMELLGIPEIGAPAPVPPRPFSAASPTP